jgi:hypothetical protein
MSEIESNLSRRELLVGGVALAAAGTDDDLCPNDIPA